MKHKLTEIDFNKIDYSTKEMDNGKIINVKYNSDTVEFQTPKVIIHEIIRENEKEYLILKINANRACKLFFDKIHTYHYYYYYYGDDDAFFVYFHHS